MLFDHQKKKLIFIFFFPFSFRAQNLMSNPSALNNLASTLGSNGLPNNLPNNNNSGNNNNPPSAGSGNNSGSTHYDDLN
jgi:hypothetical protein